MEADKRSAASGRAVPIKSTVGEIQLVKIHFRKLCKTSKCLLERQFAAMSSLHYFLGTKVKKSETDSK